jgi:hypothetical protein
MAEFSLLIPDTLQSTFLVEQAQRRSLKTGTAVTYFYCDHAQPESLQASTILASFFKQLLIHLDHLKKPCPPEIQDELTQAFKAGQRTLGPDILVDLITSFSEVFIFIDGMDECDQSDIKEILKFVQRLSTSPSLRSSSKIFIAGRKEVDVQRTIPSCISVTAGGSGHSEDIRRYIAKTVDDRTANSGRINDAALVQYVKDKLIDGAQGM